jgi:hypothetical protein
MPQTILTFICEINPDKRGRLVGLLEQIQNNREANSYVPFAALKSLHFAGFVIFDDVDYGSKLVFENNFDGSLDDYLNELSRHAGHGLHEIYGCCSDYPAGKYRQQNLVTYLHRKVVFPNAFHVGNVGRSAERIRQESLLRRKIEEHLDEITAPDKTNAASANSLRNSVQAFTQGDSSLDWAKETQIRQTLAERIIPWVKVIFAALGVLVLLPIIVPLTIVWLIILRRKEKRDSDDFQDNFQFVPYVHVRKLVEREDRIVQNHLASITVVKPGWFRRFTLKLVLRLANLVARTSNKGKLSGIPSIHFAHWSLIDNGRRLLFLSNYGGSWGSYLDDFIDKASLGLTAIWSNTSGFPPAKFLAFKGASDGPRFKSFARESQTAAIVWYSAYPDLTVQNIDNNSAIREDLYTALDDDGIKKWLQRF